MANITPYATKNGRRWRVRYRKPDGTQTDKRGFQRKIDAENWAAEHVTTAKASGTYIDPQDAKATMGELGDAYYRKKCLRAKASSISDYRTRWYAYARPYWAHVRVGDVNRQMLQDWVQHLCDGDPTGNPPRKPLAANTVTNTFHFLRGVFVDAVADRRIPANPCDGVELPRAREKPRRYLTVRQLYQLADECKWRRDVILTLGLCGMRWGELVGLSVGDVDLAKRRITIRRAATRVRSKFVVDDPKTYASRTIMFPGALDDAMRSRCEGRDPGMLLFVAPYNDADDDHAFLTGASATAKDGWFSTALHRCGLPHMTLHDLRHTAASLMIHAGANVKAVQRQLGHANASMTLDTYADLFDDDLDVLGREMDELVSRENVGKMWAKQEDAN